MAKKFKINASDGSIKRYSDVVPQEKRRYWYFTTHGIGPGMLPSDVKILETKEGQNKKGTWGDFICLDSVLNTDELKAYDLIELAPDMVESACGNKKAVKSATRKPLRKQAVKASAKESDSKKFRIDIYDKNNPDGLKSREYKSFATKEEAQKYGESIAKGNTVNVMEVKASAKNPVKSSTKRRYVKASDIDADRPNSAPNSWKSSQRMAYKVTEDQTKGERTFPTDIDDVYKALGEMQGTWTNPTTGWTGDCEIYERDLDDGSYIFSLVFGGNELEPDDILYVPGGFDYYSNKPKFTIYPHSGAPTFADSLEDFKRKLKKEYSYLRKVDGVKSSVKASKATSEEAYYVVLDPAGFVQSTYSGVLSKKGESQLRQAGKVKKFTDYDKFCEFIDNNYDERKANTKLQENASSSTKKVVKASAVAKYKANRAIKCSFDEGDPWEYQESYDYYYDEEPPAHIAKELERLAKLTDMYQDRWFEKFEELHPGERFSSVDPHPDVDEAVGYTLDEAEYSPDDIKASTKAIKANDGIAPDDYDSVDDMVSDGVQYNSTFDSSITDAVYRYINDNYNVYLSDVEYVEYTNPENWVVDCYQGSDAVESDFIWFIENNNTEIYDKLFYPKEYIEDPEMQAISDKLADTYAADNAIICNDFHVSFYPQNGQYSAPQVDLDEAELAKIGFSHEEYLELFALVGQFETYCINAYREINYTLGSFLAELANEEVSIESSTDVNADLQLNKDSADRKKYNWGKNPITDLDGYVKDIADGVVDRFPNLTYEISDEAITFSDENNNVVYVQPIDEIVPEKEDLENDTEDLANAIQHEQEESDWYNQNTDYVEMSTSDDELEPIMGDGFGEDDMGYGFNSNGDPIDESTVDELCRIANEILQKSELAKIDPYVSIDRDTFKYYASSPHVEEEFYIYFNLTLSGQELYDMDVLQFDDDRTLGWDIDADYEFECDIIVKNGEVMSFIWVDVPEERSFEAYADYNVLEGYVEKLASPVAMDIYNGTTNI